jgi:nucleoside 2-deoxyribosyltransferase
VLYAIERGDIPDRSVSEKLLLFLSSLCERSYELGRGLSVDLQRDYPVAWCRSAAELHWLIETAKELQWIRLFGGEVDVLQFNEFALEVLPTGWMKYESRPKAKGHQVFVAMAFRTELDPLYKKIEAAMGSAGYRATRVDQEPHNIGVVDKIIALIRESRFVVADLTFNRGGVYYEAGFARGLGMEVFLTCEEGQLAPSSDQRIHFDVAHLHINTWKTDTLDVFAENLKNRVLAAVGRGPLEPTAK